ncbi:MAG: Ig-like domain-containing protein [Spirochaetales bacterium]|nr:Ig-like domain-containing protein [Spirochaetales bacterium]
MSKFITISLATLALMSACELVNLDQLDCSTYPDVPDAVLGEKTPIWIEFSSPVMKSEAELLLKILSPAGNVPGDPSWEGTRLLLTPRSAFEPGVRYVLSFSGEIGTEDGRRFTVSRTVPFFSVSSDLPARLQDSAPPPGGTIGGTAPLTFTFTKAMDTTISADDYFSITPRADFTSEWTDDDTRLVIRPHSHWSPLTLYSWTISAKLRDAAGIALLREYEGSFLIQNPAAPAPVVAALRPALNSAEDRFPPAGGALLPGTRLDSWIGYRDAIRIEFSVPDSPGADDPAHVDFASLQTAFRLSPSVPGSLHCVKTNDGRDECFVFAPDPGQRYRMDTVYHITISRDLANTEGVAMESEFEAWFTPNLPVISVEQIIVSNADSRDVNLTVKKEDFNSYIELDASVPAGYSPDYYTVVFNDDFHIAPEEVYSLADNIELTRVFPETGGPYEKRNAVYLEGTPPGLTVAFWGVPADYGTVFRLRVKGGPEGVVDSRGSYLPRDVFIYFILTEEQP